MVSGAGAATTPQLARTQGTAQHTPPLTPHYTIFPFPPQHTLATRSPKALGEGPEPTWPQRLEPKWLRKVKPSLPSGLDFSKLTHGDPTLSTASTS